MSDGGPVDVLINNAGYFYGPCEKVTENSLNFEEELKQIDICAVGPLRVSNALYQAGGLVEGSKIAIVTSQAGSCEWRFTQNKDEGGDYGHHMSRAACNIGGVLLAEELKSKGVCVVLLHPGFNRTEMTMRSESIWDALEGARARRAKFVPPDDLGKLRAADVRPLPASLRVRSTSEVASARRLEKDGRVRELRGRPPNEASGGAAPPRPDWRAPRRPRPRAPPRLEVRLRRRRDTAALRSPSGRRARPARRRRRRERVRRVVRLHRRRRRRRRRHLLCVERPGVEAGGGSERRQRVRGRRRVEAQQVGLRPRDRRRPEQVVRPARAPAATPSPRPSRFVSRGGGAAAAAAALAAAPTRAAATAAARAGARAASPARRLALTRMRPSCWRRGAGAAVVGRVRPDLEARDAAPEAQVEAARQREVAPHVADAHRALAHELEDVGVRRVVAVFRDVVADALHALSLPLARGTAPASAARRARTAARAVVAWSGCDHCTPSAAALRA